MGNVILRGRYRSGLFLLLFGLALVAFAACTDSSDSDDPTATTTAPAPTATTAAAADPTATNVPDPTAMAPDPTAMAPDPTATPQPRIAPVATTTSAGDDRIVTASVTAYSDTEMGDILVGADGLTLYIFDRDTEGVSNCSGGCLSAWPPFIVENRPVAGDGVTASIGSIARDDGSQQVTVNGFPAYYWWGDAAEGDTNGHGVNDAWWVFSPDGTPQRPAKIGTANDAEMGDILVGPNGQTLYIFDRDTEGVSNCSGGCLNAWPPYFVDETPEVGTGVLATISTITTAEGLQQVTVNGFPAYYWQGDATEGDTNGHGVNNAWWVFNPDGTPQRPAKISTVNDAKMGDILVGPNGQTLYIFDRDTEGVSNCSGGCLNAWPPLLTNYGSVAVDDITANIGTTTLEDGSQQVTVNGFPAYYWQGDAAEGDTNGHGVNNIWWVFNPDGSPQRPAKVGTAEHSTLGVILVDGSGRTLYLFDNDSAGVSNCSGGCLANWPPLLTNYSPVAIGDITATVGTITRDDGTTQVTVAEMPVYYWVNDSVSGDIGGQSLGSVWWVMRASGSAIRN